MPTLGPSPFAVSQTSLEPELDEPEEPSSLLAQPTRAIEKIAAVAVSLVNVLSRRKCPPGARFRAALHPNAGLRRDSLREVPRPELLSPGDLESSGQGQAGGVCEDLRADADAAFVHTQVALVQVERRPT